MTGIFAMVLGMASALAAAPDAGVPLPDPTRPYAFATAIEVEQDLPAAGVQWRLNGIRIRAGDRSAILNGRVVKPGDSVGGAKVVEINPAEVVLMQDSQKIVVKLVLSGIKKPARNTALEQPAED